MYKASCVATCGLDNCRFAYHHVPVAKDSLVPWYLTTPEFLHPMEGPSLVKEGRGLRPGWRGLDSFSFKANNEIWTASLAQEVKCTVFIIDLNSAFSPFFHSLAGP